jgi:hypothetical protein
MLNEGPFARKGKNAAFAVEYGPRTCRQSCLKRINFVALSGDNLPPCNFHGVLAKDMNFQPKEGDCTAVNETVT